MKGDIPPRTMREMQRFARESGVFGEKKWRHFRNAGSGLVLFFADCSSVSGFRNGRG
uniref:Uncharacterized protein n=1 Tax=Faecalibaculum rodentium TaxID=1702221 RepID=A0A140DRS3_9FIRM|nr:hypothetical protein AALO17_02160 [Faecalibaculum rodentium]